VLSHGGGIVKILLFGATGATGRHVLAQALAKGHTVTAFVREPSRLADRDERMRVIVGDTTRDAPAVADAMPGQDAAVSALGRGNTLRADHLIERSMRVIVPAMERAGVRRLILLSAFGVGESRRHAPWVSRVMYRVLLGNIFRDKLAGERRVRQSSLDWTIVYPTLLTNGPLTLRYRAGELLELRGMPRISRADVARFILIEAENRGFVKKVVTLSY
jgi:putative NADH-flavin reductase